MPSVRFELFSRVLVSGLTQCRPAQRTLRHITRDNCNCGQIVATVWPRAVLSAAVDIGRPDQVALVFDRKLIGRGPRATPGPFRTRVIAQGVTPSLYVDYKHTRIKQLAKSTHAIPLARANRCTAVLKASVILASGAVEAIGNPSCRCT